MNVEIQMALIEYESAITMSHAMMTTREADPNFRTDVMKYLKSARDSVLRSIQGDDLSVFAVAARGDICYHLLEYEAHSLNYLSATREKWSSSQAMFQARAGKTDAYKNLLNVIMAYLAT